MSAQFDLAAIIVAACDGEKIVTAAESPAFGHGALPRHASTFTALHEISARSAAFGTFSGLEAALRDIIETMRYGDRVHAAAVEVIDVPLGGKVRITSLTSEFTASDATYWVDTTISKLAQYLPSELRFKVITVGMGAS